MSGSLLAAILTLMAGAVPAADSVQSLNGVWEMQRTTAAESPQLGTDWEAVTVPSHVPQAAPAYAWYRRAFELPASARGRHVFVSFGGAKFACDVYVNGRRVGAHYGGWEPFELEVTDACRADGPNELLVRVQDVRALIDGEVEYGPGRDLIESIEGRVMAPVGSQTTLFGIWQDVDLVIRNDVFIEDVTIVTSVRQKRIEANYVLRNLGRQPSRVTLRAEVTDEGRTALELGSEAVTIQPGATAECTLASPWPTPKLWMPDSPHLYHLESGLVADGEAMDAASTRFGFREFWTDGIYFVLNGVRMKFLATAGHPPRGGLLTDEEIRQKYAAIRSANCMAMRLHANVWPENWYDVADEVGLPIIEESAIWCFARNYALEREEFWKNAREHWHGIIRRDKNHPAVVMYSIENEILHVGGDRVPGTEVKLGELGRFVKSLDPTRPIMYDGDEDPDGAADVVNLHYPHEFPEQTLYPNTCYWINERTSVSGWPRREWEWDRRKPLYIGEFLWMPARSAHGLTTFLGDEAYRSLWQGLRECKARAWQMQIEAYRSAEVSGTCPWTLWESGAFPNEQYLAVRQAYEPNAAFVKEYGRRFYGGERIERTVFLYNDTLGAADLTLIWRLGGEVQGQREFSLGPAERVETPIELTPPAVSAPTDVEFELIVKSGTRTVYRSAADVAVYPRSPNGLAVPAGTKLAVYGMPRNLLDVLRAGGVEPVRLGDLGDAGGSGARVLIIGPHALDGLGGEDEMPVVGGGAHAALADFVTGGGTLLVLEQDRYPADMLPAHLQERAATIAFPRSRAGGVTDGLPDDAFKFWRDDNFVARRLIVKPREGAFRAFADAGGPQGLEAALLLEVLHGKGRCILSQLLIGEKLGREPMARLMFERLVSHACGRQPPQRRLALVRGQRALDDDLKAVGAEFDDLTGALSTADLAPYPVLMLDGTSEEVVAARGRLQQFVRGGGTALLHGVDERAMAALRDVIPGELTVRPTTQVPVLIAERGDPLMDGMLNEDLYWIFDWGGDWRRQHPLFAGVLHGEVTRRPPPLAQCSVIEAETMRPTDSAQQMRMDEGRLYMWTNAVAEGEIVLPRTGEYVFGLVGSGTSVSGVFPNVAVSVDGEVVGNISVSGPESGSFSIRARAEGGRHRLRLAFTNDAYDPDKGEDRNLTLDKFFFAESQPGPEVDLLRPAGLVRIADGDGFWLIDQVAWDGRVRSLDHAARYLSGLLMNLGVSFTGARRGTVISGARLAPVGELDNFRREGSVAYMGSSGTIEVGVRFTQGGRHVVEVIARGTPASGEYPEVRLLVDGEAVGARQLQGEGWEALPFEATVRPGVHTLGLQFTNDAWEPERGEDRNLWIRRLTIGGGTQ